MKSSTSLAFILMFIVVHAVYPVTASQERRDRLLKMMAQQAVNQVKLAGSTEEYLQKVAKAQMLLKHVQARDKQEAQRLATVMAATEEELVSGQQEINVQQQQEVAASATEEFKKLMEKIKAHNIQFTREEYLLNERKALQLVEQMFPKLSGVNQEAIASIKKLINTINTEYTKAIQKQATNTAGWIWSVNTKEYLDNFYKGVDRIARKAVEHAQQQQAQQEEQGPREQGQEVQQQRGSEQSGVNAYDAFKKAIQEIRNHKKRYTPQERKASEDKVVKGAEFALKTILPIKRVQAAEVFKNQYRQAVQFQADAVTPKPKKGKKPAANVSKEVVAFNNRINSIVQKLNQQQQERDIQSEEPRFEQEEGEAPIFPEQQEFILPPGLQLPAIPPVPGRLQVPVQPGVQLNAPNVPGNVPAEMPQAPVVPVVKVEPEKDPQQEFDKYIEFIVKKAKERRVYGDEEEGDDDTLFAFAEKIMRKQTDSSALKNAYDDIINKYNTAIKASYRTDVNRESGLGEDTRLTDFDKRVSEVYEALREKIIKAEDASAVGPHKQFLDFINALAEKRLLDETELKQHEDEAVALATQWLAQTSIQDKPKVAETIKERYKRALRAEAQNSTDWLTWARDTTQEEQSFNQQIDEAVIGKQPEAQIPAQGAGMAAE